jgi:hypothetical protein
VTQQEVIVLQKLSTKKLNRKDTKFIAKTQRDSDGSKPFANFAMLSVFAVKKIPAKPGLKY